MFNSLIPWKSHKIFGVWDFHVHISKGFRSIWFMACFIILYAITPSSAWFYRLHAFICILSIFFYIIGVLLSWKSNSFGKFKKLRICYRTNLPRSRSCIHFRPWEASLAECQRWSVLWRRLMHWWHTLLSKWTFSRRCQAFECSWLSSYWTLTLWWSDCSRCRNYFRKTWNIFFHILINFFTENADLKRTIYHVNGKLRSVCTELLENPNNILSE